MKINIKNIIPIAIVTGKVLDGVFDSMSDGKVTIMEITNVMFDGIFAMVDENLLTLTNENDKLKLKQVREDIMILMAKYDL